MPTPYTSPTKLTTSVLVHIGDFQVNQVDGGVTPPEYVLTTDSVAVTTSFVLTILVIRRLPTLMLL